MKWIKSISAIIVVVLLLVVLNHTFTTSSGEDIDDNTTIVDNVIFPHDEVIEANIEIDEDAYAEINANATSEEFVMANITYNGKTFNNVAVRPKGNSSLRDVFTSDSDRYSFKIDFNYYVDDQSFYGITKLNLNNLFSDPSMMAEYIGYEMLDELDAVSSRTTYVNLSINGEPFGLYLAVEQVNDEFLIDNFGNSSGDLYKPEQGVGSDLSYVSDDGMDYTGLFPKNNDDYDNEEIAELIKAINNGEDLDSILDVDSFLKYLAVSTMTVHLDSYQGGMFHNYYLYDNDGVFEWIAWDLNMIFNGYPGSNMTDEQAVEFLIDEPVSGSMENYPLVQAIFENEEYVAQYHEYLETLSNGYLQEDNFNEKVLSTYKMIKSYVKSDPTSFYTYEEFENGLFAEDDNSLGLISFVQNRVENVSQQLSGKIDSTNNGEGNVGSSMRGGMNGQGQNDNGERLPPEDMQNQMLEEMEGKTPEELIQLITTQMGDQVSDDMKEQILQELEGKTSDEIIEIITNQMSEQMSGPLNNADGQVAQDGGQLTPPDDANGQMPQDGGQLTPPNNQGGQMGDQMGGQNTKGTDAQQQSEDTSSMPSDADMLILVALCGLIIAASIFLHRKH